MFLRLCKTSDENSKAKAPAARCSAETFYLVKKEELVWALHSAGLVERLAKNGVC
jgi:hypothetical protein